MTKIIDMAREAWKSVSSAVALLMWKMIEVPSRSRTVTHEAGHALIAWTSSTVTRITAIAIGATNDIETVGFTNYVTFYRHDPEAPHDLWELCAISLAGLAAEEVVYGFFIPELAKTDLQKASQRAKQIVINEEECKQRTCPWGDLRLEEVRIDFVWRAFVDSQPDRRQEILNICYSRALKMLRAERSRLDALGAAIAAKKRLNTADIEAILGKRS